jgi:hypothetical protein
VSLSGVWPVCFLRGVSDYVCSDLESEKGMDVCLAGAPCAGVIAEADASAVFCPPSSPSVSGYGCLTLESERIVEACFAGAACAGAVAETDVSAVTCLRSP